MSTWLISQNDEEKKVIENQGLVYFIVNKLNISPSDVDDAVSAGFFGLLKAVRTFNASKSIHFATYATTCINNEILMYLRKNKKRANDVSLDAPIHTDEDGHELILGDLLPSTTKSAIDEIEEREILARAFSIILNALKPKQKLVMLYKLAGFTQARIAEFLNISQSYICRIEKKSSIKVKSIFNNFQQFKEVFTMSIVNNLYQITFSTSDVNNFNQIFSSLLVKFKSKKDLPNFNIIRNNNKVIIQTTADPTSFYFIARIIQEIDDFSMSYVNNQNTSYTDDVDLQVVDSCDKSVTKTIEVDTYTKKRGDNAKRIMKYVLSQDEFSIKQLVAQFSDISYATINNSIHNAKRKNLITRIGRGKYKVNKDKIPKNDS